MNKSAADKMGLLLRGYLSTLYDHELLRVLAMTQAKANPRKYSSTMLKLIQQEIERRGIAS